jgi:hypothetical protein
VGADCEPTTRDQYPDGDGSAPGIWGTVGTTAGTWGTDGAAIGTGATDAAAAGEPIAAELAAAGEADADAAGEGEARPMFCMAWPAAFCPACCAAPAAAPAAAEPAPCITLPPVCARAQRGMHKRMSAPVNPTRPFMECPPDFGKLLAQTCPSMSSGSGFPGNDRASKVRIFALTRSGPWTSLDAMRHWTH